MNDEALVQQFWDRDEAAIPAAKERYGQYCLYVANNVLQDPLDAEECLNDALLAAWNSIPPQRPQNLKTYLGKLIREIAVNRWRRNRAQKRITPEAVVSLDELEELVGTGSVEEVVEEEELARAITAFLRTLPEIQRELFIRRYWYCDSIEQICKRYGFGKSRVTVTLKRTRDKLAEHLKKEGYLI